MATYTITLAVVAAVAVGVAIYFGMAGSDEASTALGVNYALEAWDSGGGDEGGNGNGHGGGGGGDSDPTFTGEMPGYEIMNNGVRITDVDCYYDENYNTVCPGETFVIPLTNADNLEDIRFLNSGSGTYKIDQRKDIIVYFDDNTTHVFERGNKDRKPNTYWGETFSAPGKKAVAIEFPVYTAEPTEIQVWGISK